VNRRLLEYLACPRHHTAITTQSGDLKCSDGCRFPVVDGVPVMLLEEQRQTMETAWSSLRQARMPNADRGLYVDSLGLNDEEKRSILRTASRHADIDPVASSLVGATNGIAYRHQVGRLREYPIPELRIRPSQGETCLDIGCGWGRWSIAATQVGYKVVGIDPSLGAVMAARRVARQLGADVSFLVADARFLPIRTQSVDVAFSYSVLQHFGQRDVASAVSEIGRILRMGGTSHVQMATKLGIRCLYHQARRGFRKAAGFEVRYWSLRFLQTLFSTRIGTTAFSVDCFFGIGLQASDLRFMTPTMKRVVQVSEALRAASHRVTPLVWLADSVFVSSVRDGCAGQPR
jgi:SAM-dependent methyltransferase/uncharacterized protein YbaR (Trm112 family)